MSGICHARLLWLNLGSFSRFMHASTSTSHCLKITPKVSFVSISKQDLFWIFTPRNQHEPWDIFWDFSTWCQLSIRSSSFLFLVSVLGIIQGVPTSFGLHLGYFWSFLTIFRPLFLIRFVSHLGHFHIPFEPFMTSFGYYFNQNLLGHPVLQLTTKEKMNQHAALKRSFQMFT